MKAYLINILIALDQLANCIFCGGWPDETMSAYSYRLHRDLKPWGFLMYFIDAGALIFFWQKNHCQNAYVSEQFRLNSPPEFRKR